MKSIMVINSKGGSGKTTIAVNLAAYCAQKGYETYLVDLDPQGSSTQWLKERPLNKSKIRGSTKFQKPLIIKQWLIDDKFNTLYIHALHNTLHGR